MSQQTEQRNRAPLNNRRAQMNKQEQIIERKKQEIQFKLEVRKQAAALASAVGAPKLSAPSINSKNIFSNDGTFMRNFKELLEKQKQTDPQNEIEAPNEEDVSGKQENKADNRNTSSQQRFSEDRGNRDYDNIRGNVQEQILKQQHSIQHQKIHKEHYHQVGNNSITKEHRDGNLSIQFIKDKHIETNEEENDNEAPRNRKWNETGQKPPLNMYYGHNFGPRPHFEHQPNFGPNGPKQNFSSSGQGSNFGQNMKPGSNFGPDMVPQSKFQPNIRPPGFGPKSISLGPNMPPVCGPPPQMIGPFNNMPYHPGHVTSPNMPPFFGPPCPPPSQNMMGVPNVMPPKNFKGDMPPFMHPQFQGTPPSGFVPSIMFPPPLQPPMTRSTSEPHFNNINNQSPIETDKRPELVTLPHNSHPMMSALNNLLKQPNIQKKPSNTRDTTSVVDRAAQQVALHGEQLENAMKSTSDPELWFLHQPQSATYKNYRELIQKYQNKSNVTTENNSEDKYDPELSLQDDSDEEFNRRSSQQPQSSTYKNYGEQLQQYRNQRCVTSKNNAEDKYDPELCLQDDSDEEFHMRQMQHYSDMISDPKPSSMKREASSQSEDEDKNKERKRKKKSRWGGQSNEAVMPPAVVTPNISLMPPNMDAMQTNMSSMPPIMGGMPPNMGGMPPNMSSMPPNMTRMSPNMGGMQTSVGSASMSSMQSIPPISGNIAAKLAPIEGGQGIQLSAIRRNNQALVQYAIMNYGSTDLTPEEWTKCEDNFKLNLLYQDMMKKRAELDRLAASGKHKYGYDSDEDTEHGTWEHKLRTKEMNATEKWADELTKQAAGKHHIGDFLPPEELKKFMEKYSAIKGGKEPDLSDYKEFKLTEENIGFKMLQKLGWNEGQGLGAEGTGIVAPINKGNQAGSNAGLGVVSADTVSADDDEFDAYRKRMMLAYRFRPNPLNNPRRAYY